MRTVGDLLGSRDVLTARPEQSIFEVAEILAANNIGALPVVATGRVVGIVSERDIIGRVVVAGIDPKTAKVEATMTKSPVTVDAGATPSRALQLMQQGKFRHLPVLRKGELAGMISLRDLLQVQISSQETELQVLSALPEREFE